MRLWPWTISSLKINTANYTATISSIYQTTRLNCETTYTTCASLFCDHFQWYIIRFMIAPNLNLITERVTGTKVTRRLWSVLFRHLFCHWTCYFLEELVLVDLNCFKGNDVRVFKIRILAYKIITRKYFCKYMECEEQLQKFFRNYQKGF